MKFAFLYQLILFFAIAKGQTPITGKWKIVSINQTGVYYNCKNDSISLSNQMAIHSSDTVNEKNTAQALKATVCNYQLIFESNSKFKFIGDSILFVIEGNYQELTTKKIIQLTNKKSLGLNDFYFPDKMRYLIKDGLLYLSIDGDDKEFELILKKDK